MSTAVPDACTPAWAHSVGVIDLQPVGTVPSELTQLADRLMVTETVSRYGIAYDERRLDVLESLMTETAAFSYRFGEGAPVGYTGRAAVIAWLEDVMTSQADQRRHLMSNILVERLTASEATVIAYTAIFGIEHEAKLITTGVYAFELVKHDNRWLIAEGIDALDRPF
ncbi:MAG TPA: nuclear transport factor 2 family protein [Pseudolysinimonas sp.]|nr:nuclear transport factor 2 family protein [Pseudolysinimonas sp.]